MASTTFPEVLNNIKGMGGWSLFFLAIVWWIRTGPAKKKADTDALTALHEDYGKHIERLQSENNRQAERIEKVEQARIDDRDKCIEENDELRELIRQLKNQVDGLQRDIASHSQSSAMLLDSANAPTMVGKLKKGEE